MFLLGVAAMSDVLPEYIREGLEAARKRDLQRKSRLKVKVGGQTFTILRYWDEGFALDIDDAPHLRGLVDVYDGGRHLSQCLIIASEEEAGEMVYEFKRETMASDAAPVDYETETQGPIALIAQK